MARLLRRLLHLASAIVFLDTVFFAAIVPLLPTYAADFDLVQDRRRACSPPPTRPGRSSARCPAAG